MHMHMLQQPHPALHMPHAGTAREDARVLAGGAR